MRNRNRLDAMWTMNHASCHSLIKFIACFCIWRLRNFSHMLIIKKELMSKGMSLSASNSHLFFKCRTTMNWACSHFLHVMIITKIWTHEIVLMRERRRHVMLVHLFIGTLTSLTVRLRVLLTWCPKVLRSRPISC